MGIGKWARRAVSVAAAPLTGGASLVGLAPDIPGFDRFKKGAKDFLLGQDPSEVELPPELAAAQERRARIADMLLGADGGGMPAGPRNEAQAAAREAAALAGQTAQSKLQNAISSQAAGARGLGSLGARRNAMRQLALGSADIAGQVAEQSAGSLAQAAAADVAAGQRDQAQRLAELGLVADLTGQSEQAALTAEEYRRQRAKKGALSELLAVGGGTLAAVAGGPQFAGTGAQIGAGVGDLFERR
jgi:hypothetical protein